MIRLVVVDAPGEPAPWLPETAVDVTERASHGVRYVEWLDGGTTDRLIAVDGILHEPRGNPPVWEPRRRAALRALTKLAASSDAVVAVSDDALFATQVRDAVCAARPDLLRTARHRPPHDDTLDDIDDMQSESNALAREIDAIIAHILHRVDAGLRLQDLPALDMVGTTPRSRSSLIADGVPEESLVRLAEHGYLVEDPAWRSPAADELRALLPAVLLDPRTAEACSLWIDAVARGILDRPTGRARVRALLDGITPLTKPRDFHTGRLVGPCPRCGDWMGGTREHIRCLGCGERYALPRGMEVRAVPGRICPVCRAPLIRPVVRGRDHAIRCPDRAGCPEAMDALR